MSQEQAQRISIPVILTQTGAILDPSFLNKMGISLPVDKAAQSPQINENVMLLAKLQEKDEVKYNEKEEAAENGTNINPRKEMEEIKQEEPEKVENFDIDFKTIANLKFTTAKDVEVELKEWGLKEGFELILDTQSKSYGVYLKCNRSGKPRIFANKEEKEIKFLAKLVLTNILYFSYLLGCKFRVSFYKNEENYLFNKELSHNTHNHPLNSNLKNKSKKQEIEKYVKEEVLKKDLMANDIQKKLVDRFSVNLEYKESANLLSKIRTENLW